MRIFTPCLFFHCVFNDFLCVITHLRALSVALIHVKLEKFKRGRSPSLHLAKEGDFVRNHSATLILYINFKFWPKFWKWWYTSIPSLYWLKTRYMMHNILLLYFVDTLLTWQCVFIAKFNTIHSFKGGNDRYRKWGSKRGRFPLLGGRWMFKREMGSKRGSFPPRLDMYEQRLHWIMLIRSTYMWSMKELSILFHNGPKEQKRSTEGCSKFKGPETRQV